MPQGAPASSTRKRGRRKARDSTCYFEILPDDLVLAILGKLRYPRVVTRAEASCTRFRDVRHLLWLTHPGAGAQAAGRTWERAGGTPRAALTPGEGGLSNCPLHGARRTGAVGAHGFAVGGRGAEITVECLESSSLEQSGKKQRNSQPDARRSSPCSPCSLPRPTRSSPASVPSPRRPRCPCTPAPARRRRSARPGCPVTSASTLWCASTPTTAARRSAPQPIVAIAHHHSRLSCAGPRQLRPVGRQRH